MTCKNVIAISCRVVALVWKCLESSWDKNLPSLLIKSWPIRAAKNWVRISWSWTSIEIKVLWISHCWFLSASLMKNLFSPSLWILLKLLRLLWQVPEELKSSAQLDLANLTPKPRQPRLAQNSLLIILFAFLPMSFAQPDSMGRSCFWRASERQRPVPTSKKLHIHHTQRFQIYRTHNTIQNMGWDSECFLDINRLQQFGVFNGQVMPRKRLRPGVHSMFMHSRIDLGLNALERNLNFATRPQPLTVWSSTNEPEDISCQRPWQTRPAKECSSWAFPLFS